MSVESIKANLLAGLQALQFNPDHTESDKNRAAIEDLKPNLSEAMLKQLEKGLAETIKRENDTSGVRSDFLKSLYAELESVFEQAGMKVIRRKSKNKSAIVDEPGEDGTPSLEVAAEAVAA